MKKLIFTMKAAVLGTVICTAGNAQAALVLYTDLASFIAATNGQVVEPNSAPPGGYQALGYATYRGISYPGYAYMIDPAYAPSLYDWGTGPVLLLSNSSSLSFAPVTAFAAGFGTLGPVGGNVTVTIDGFAYTFPTPDEKRLTFFGWTSADPFSSVTISTNTSYAILDNVTRARAGLAPPPIGVPEPASLALMGLGMLGIALGRRGKPA